MYSLGAKSKVVSENRIVPIEDLIVPRLSRNRQKHANRVIRRADHRAKSELDDVAMRDLMVENGVVDNPGGSISVSDGSISVVNESNVPVVDATILDNDKYDTETRHTYLS